MNFDIRQKMLELPEPTTDKRPPHWEYWRNNLWKNVVEQGAELFHTFPCVYHTMLVNHWKNRIAQEVDEILAWEKHDRVTAPMLQHVTKMPDHDTQDANEAGLSINLVHQYYHLRKWERETGSRIVDMDRIVEYGGGYGAMALVAFRMGFKGDYYIYDSPEFTLLQQYYLSRVLTEDEFSRVHWNDKRVRVADLLIACYSLSEVSIEERNKFLAKLKVMGYLFLYSNKFASYDNMAYFKDFADQNQPGRWSIQPAVHLPEGNWYAFGGFSV